MFGVFGVVEIRWFFHVAEVVTAKHVAIGFSADSIVAVVGAIDDDFPKRAVGRTAHRVAELEDFIKVGFVGDIIDEGERGSFCIPDEFFHFIAIV